MKIRRSGREEVQFSWKYRPFGRPEALALRQFCVYITVNQYSRTLRDDRTPRVPAADRNSV